MSNNRTTKRLVHFDLMRIIACFLLFSFMLIYLMKKTY